MLLLVPVKKEVIAARRAAILQATRLLRSPHRAHRPTGCQSVSLQPTCCRRSSGRRLHVLSVGQRENVRPFANVAMIWLHAVAVLLVADYFATVDAKGETLLHGTKVCAENYNK